MKFKVWYGDEVEFLFIEILEMLSEKEVHEMMALTEKLYEGKPRRYALIDLSFNPGGIFDKSARRAFQQYASKMQSGKMAVVGAKPFARMLAKAAVAALGSQEMTRFFKTKEEALEWLKD